MPDKLASRIEKCAPHHTSPVCKGKTHQISKTHLIFGDIIIAKEDYQRRVSWNLQVIFWRDLAPISTRWGMVLSYFLSILDLLKFFPYAVS